jgi:hypothetical protein
MLACFDSRSPAWDKPRSQRQSPKNGQSLAYLSRVLSKLFASFQEQSRPSEILEMAVIAHMYRE